jgi:hypothetical protein
VSAPTHNAARAGLESVVDALLSFDKALSFDEA